MGRFAPVRIHRNLRRRRIKAPGREGSSAVSTTVMQATNRHNYATVAALRKWAEGIVRARGKVCVCGDAEMVEKAPRGAARRSLAT